MSKAITLKNGIPSFDASGSVSMIPRSSVDQPFGFSTIAITYTEEPTGGTAIVLISDLGAYPVSDGFGMCGFAGIFYKHNGGYLGNGYGMCIINATVGYSINGAGPCLTTTYGKVLPLLVKYNGRVYIALKVSGNTGYLYMYGRTFSMLASPIILNNRNGLNVTDAEILATGIVGGGVNRYAPISYNLMYSAVQKGGQRNEQRDKHQRRSYTLLTQGGHIQRIAQRDNVRCPGSERIDSERQQRRRDYQTWNIHCCFRNKYTRSSNWGIQVWQPVRGKGECLPLPNIPNGRRKRLSTKDVHWGRMAALVPSRDRHSSLIATRRKEVAAI